MNVKENLQWFLWSVKNNKGKKCQENKGVCCTWSELRKYFGRSQWQERSPEKNTMV